MSDKLKVGTRKVVLIQGVAWLANAVWGQDGQCYHVLDNRDDYIKFCKQFPVGTPVVLEVAAAIGWPHSAIAWRKVYGPEGSDT